MNKRQTEVEKAKLAAEAQELKELKAMYEEAAEQIAKNISITDGKMKVLLENWDDLSDDDKSVYQSKIYQKNFQKQLQEQINEVLKDLNSGQYKSIDEYLKKCYETGFVGTMYDIAGQGIPIISPIDQKKVVKAIRTNSKISGGCRRPPPPSGAWQRCPAWARVPSRSRMRVARCAAGCIWSTGIPSARTAKTVPRARYACAATLAWRIFLSTPTSWILTTGDWM